MTDIKKLVWLAEVTIVFTLIMLHVWLVPKFNPLFVGIIFGLIVISWYWHKDKLWDLGLKPMDDDSAITVFKFAVSCASILFVIGLLFNENFPFEISLMWKFPESVLFYFFWAFFQQLVLNGFVANRLRVLNHPEPIAIITGILFSVIHAPNPFLMITTIIGGSMSAYYFIRSQNVYILAFAHALIAVSISYFLPFEWHRGLNIGPNYFPH